ncbi:hypothetical protein [Streptomyces sp. B21-083]|uniref:hypothetical protein n=1 Tax=Streptomyces sp. B21-083 TaxID=3039410 RepID=UPI002FF2E7F4
MSEDLGEFGVGKGGKRYVGGVVMGAGLLQCAEDILVSADGAEESGQAEAGLSGAGVVAESGECLFCQHDGVAEAVCLNEQQCLEGQCPAVASMVAAGVGLLERTPDPFCGGVVTFIEGPCLPAPK